MIAGGVIGASHPLLSLARYLKETHPKILAKIQAAKDYKADYRAKNLEKFWRSTSVGDIVGQGGTHFNPSLWASEMLHGSPIGHVVQRVPGGILHPGQYKEPLHTVPNSLLQEAYDAGEHAPFFTRLRGKLGVQPQSWLASRLFAGLAAPDTAKGTAALPAAVHLKPVVPYTKNELAAIKIYMQQNKSKLKDYGSNKALLNALGQLGLPGAAEAAGTHCTGTTCYQTPIDILKMLGRGAGPDSSGLNNVLLNPHLRVESVYNKRRLLEVLGAAKKGRIGLGVGLAGLLGGGGMLAGKALSNAGRGSDTMSKQAYARGFTDKCAASGINAAQLTAALKSVGELTEHEVGAQGLKLIKIPHQFRLRKPKAKMLWRKEDFTPVTSGKFHERRETAVRSLWGDDYR